MIGNCTHEISLKYWTVKNTHHEQPYEAFNNLKFNEDFEDNVHLLLGLMYILENIRTGYYQVYAKPIKWSLGYVGKYPSLLKTYIDNYPRDLQEKLYDFKPSLISKEKLRILKQCYKALTGQEKTKEETKWNSKLKFCLRKLYQSGLRDKISDSILDLTIVLESLLTNQSKTEITYRLSTIGSYLCKLHKFKNYKPTEIKYLLTKLYNLRSSIVHADSNKNQSKSRYCVFRSNEKFDLYPFAFEIAKHLLKILILNKGLRNYKNLESKILNYDR